MALQGFCTLGLRDIDRATCKNICIVTKMFVFKKKYYYAENFVLLSTCRRNIYLEEDIL